MHLVKCFEPKTNLSCKYTKFANLFLSSESSQTQEKECCNPQKYHNESTVYIWICDWHAF